jgi:hypothetical protein
MLPQALLPLDAHLLMIPPTMPSLDQLQLTPFPLVNAIPIILVPPAEHVTKMPPGDLFNPDAILLLMNALLIPIMVMPTGPLPLLVLLELAPALLNTLDLLPDTAKSI